MSFRGHDSSVVPEPAVDPLTRFLALHGALDEGRGMFGDRVPLRLAAVTLITTPGAPAELVARVRACDAELAPHFGWLSDLTAPVRLVLAAALVRVDESVPTFVAAMNEGRALMRAAGIRRGGVHEVLAMLVLRRVLGRRAIGAADIARFHAIYAEMKRHHWFLTGPNDFTACAMLVGRRGTPPEIGEHCEAIYRRLARAPKTWRGEALQMATNVLGLVELAPDEAAQRFLDVATALRDSGVRVGQDEYDDVAVLSMVPRAADKIAQMVVHYRGRLDAELSWLSGSLATSLAANLGFVRLVSADEAVAALGDAKLLLDMQSIVTARQSSGM
ncbi:MAG TPA: DUF4003 family protein [Nannocystaceae bacterium]|nr:DUF4003 family protein [Nannocystaceae bacterium]